VGVIYHLSSKFLLADSFGVNELTYVTCFLRDLEWPTTLALQSKKPHKGVDSHCHQRARLIAAYLQSQSEPFSLGHRGDETQCILVISTFAELRSHVTTNWGETQKSGCEKL